MRHELDVPMSDGTSYILTVYEELAEPQVGYSGALTIDDVVHITGDRLSEDEFFEVYKEEEGEEFDLMHHWAEYCRSGW